MTLTDRLRRVLRQQARKAGREYARSRDAYREGRREGGAPDRVDPAEFGLPDDGEGNARVVCRRYVERRAVAVDAEGRPDCFEADNVDCEGCAEDVRDGRVQTW
ncbi:DUF7091 family protein [Halorarum salinum]|uniref:DUF7091 family protein n=1 Tax=Halorarum salinum TaxID=2743089 RepID=UPI003743DFCC